MGSDGVPASQVEMPPRPSGMGCLIGVGIWVVGFTLGFIVAYQGQSNSPSETGVPPSSFVGLGLIVFGFVGGGIAVLVTVVRSIMWPYKYAKAQAAVPVPYPAGYPPPPKYMKLRETQVD